MKSAQGSTVSISCADIKLFVGYRNANKEAQDEDNDTALLTAVEYGSAECASVLLEHGARIHAVNRLEQNAVHVAAKYNEIETMQVLHIRLLLQ